MFYVVIVCEFRNVKCSLSMLRIVETPIKMLARVSLHFGAQFLKSLTRKPTLGIESKDNFGISHNLFILLKSPMSCNANNEFGRIWLYPLKNVCRSNSPFLKIRINSNSRADPKTPIFKLMLKKLIRPGIELEIFVF